MVPVNCAAKEETTKLIQKYRKKKNKIKDRSYLFAASFFHNRIEKEYRKKLCMDFLSVYDHHQRHENIVQINKKINKNNNNK